MTTDDMLRELIALTNAQIALLEVVVKELKKKPNEPAWPHREKLK